MNSQSFACDVCRQPFLDLAHLNYHVGFYHPDHRLSCTHCIFVCHKIPTFLRHFFCCHFKDVLRLNIVQDAADLIRTRFVGASQALMQTWKQATSPDAENAGTASLSHDHKENKIHSSDFVLGAMFLGFGQSTSVTVSLKRRLKRLMKR
ncbi:hypothetical protein HGRIS_001379 [Hohenbuehelia grisea]|uniref:C2H2-type domain-containing protein n=1 Tax=Hohenbuehelia grisea TaxID=104357 RepID=A0ABR3JR03_9AGAR